MIHGSRVYKLFDMGNGCRENSRFVSDVFRQSCISPVYSTRAVLKLGPWNVNAEIESNSVPHYLSKQNEPTVKYQNDWLGSIV